MDCTLGKIRPDSAQAWVRCTDPVRPHVYGGAIEKVCATHKLMMMSLGFNHRKAGYLDLLDDTRLIMVEEVARARYRYKGLDEDEVYAHALARLITLVGEREEALRQYMQCVEFNGTVNSYDYNIRYLKSHKPFRWRHQVKVMEAAKQRIIDRGA